MAAKISLDRLSVPFFWGAFFFAMSAAAREEERNCTWLRCERALINSSLGASIAHKLITQYFLNNELSVASVRRACISKNTYVKC